MSNSDENFDRTTKNPWNMVFMRDENDGAQSEDYKISASLKQIWSDVSDDETVDACSNADSSQHNVPQGYFAQPPPPTEYVQFGNNVIAIAAQSTPVAQPLGTGSHYNTVSNNVNPNSMRRRAITSRNGGHSAQYLGNENRENQPSNNSSVSSIPSNSSLHANSISWAQTLPIEAFLQKVQVIIKNGFLDPKILTEPTAPECFDLCQMLIFYVMEYGKAKVNSNQQEVEKNFYKINLIQNEILRCQEQFIEQNRVQQNILESYAAQEQKQQNFTSQPMSNQYGQSNGKNQWQNVPKALETTPSQRNHDFWDGITPENVSSSDEDSGKSSPEDDQETVSAGLEALAARAHASILNLSACPDFQQKERVHSIFGFAHCIMKHYDRFVR